MADVKIEIDVETRKAIKDLAKLEKEFKDLDKEAKKSGKDSDKSFSLMSKGAAGAAIAVAALAKGFQFAISEAIKIEDLETSFISFTGSAESAADQIERLAEFSASTPFQLEELARANRTLLAFGSGTDESVTQLKQLGEAAAATGSDIGELATIFGQIQAETKLSSERFNQLVERGINIGPILAESLGVAESSLKDLRAQGKISSDDVAKAFETLANTKFAGALERQSKTLSGSISTLKDNVSLLAASFGKTLQPAIVFIVDELTNAAKVSKAFLDGLKGDDLGPLEQKIVDTKDALSDYVDELQELKKDGPGFFQSQEAFNEELKQTENIVRSTTNVLKKLQAARRTEKKDEPAAEKDKAVESVDNDALQAAKDIENQLATIRSQRLASEKASAAAENEAVIEQLDVRRELLLQKEADKNIALLESKGQFEEAALAQAKENLRRIEEAEKESDAKRKAQIMKAKADEFNFEKKTADAKKKFNEQTVQQNLATSKAGLNALASLQQTGSKEAFEIGKAAAIASALVDIPKTAISAYSSLAGIPIVGPGLGAAAAAAAVAAGTAQVNRIRSQQFTAFADGGVVPGTGNQDNVPALLTPGEVVVPERDFQSLNLGRGDEQQRAIRNGIDETNGLLRELIVVGTTQSEGFLEEKFSSSTPGGIFYEAVDDGVTLEEDAEARAIIKARQNFSRGGTSGRISSPLIREELRNKRGAQ